MAQSNPISKTLSGTSTAIDATQTQGRAGRSIVLLFDGTSNEFDINLTNLPVIMSLLEADPEKQCCYYQTGVGTYAPVWSTSGLVTRISQLADEAEVQDIETHLGSHPNRNLGQHIQDGYEFLMNTYKPDDRIYLMGFSRGAYTARALAGMLQQVGLLLPHNKQSIPLAYSIYKQKANTPFIPAEGNLPAIDLAAAFRRDFSRQVCVHFVGVWDTVSSVGAIIPRTLPFASGNFHIRHFRHAISLDEHRARFAYQPWIGPIDDQADDFKISDGRTCTTTPHATDVKEVFFAGDHCDIGGGASATDDNRSPRLSNISLRWMIKEAMDAGLQFDETRLLTSSLFSKFVQPVSSRLAKKDELILSYLKDSPAIEYGTQTELTVAICSVAAKEVEASLEDAKAPRHDALSYSIGYRGAKDIGPQFQQRLRTGFWWLLEFMPTVKIVWDAAGQAKKWSCWPAFGRARNIIGSPLVHHSVKSRMHASVEQLQEERDGASIVEKKKYVPRGKLQKGDSWEEVEYV